MWNLEVAIKWIHQVIVWICTIVKYFIICWSYLTRVSLDNAFSLRTLLSEAEENVALGKYRQIISRMKSSLLWKRFIYPVYASLAFTVLWQKGKIFRIGKSSVDWDIRVKFAISNSPQSPDIGQNSKGGVSDFRISGQSLIKENCHNSRTSDDIDMKLGPVTKVDIRNKTASKKLTMMSCQQIVTSMSFFQIWSNL